MGQLNLLLVDDEEMLVASLERFFTRKDFNVFKAEGVAAAREIIKKETIQVLITDMRMPDGLGSELIGLQRKLHPSSVIICCTGFSEEDEAEIITKGADYIVAKPFEKKDLMEKIFLKLSVDT